MDALAAVIERLDAFTTARLAERNIAGLALALTDREQTLYETGYGFADIAARMPVSPRHLFEFGSIGKSFTSIVWLQLREAGVVDLHAPFSEYLPWFSVRSDYGPITPHHLLSHSAGIINGTDFTPDQRFEVWALRDTETGSPPGSYYHYSNLGYKALGLALERLLGKPYEEIIQERIFDPLGMSESTGAITHNTRSRQAVGYDWLYDDRPSHPRYPLVPATWLETDTGDGCLSSTAGDLVKYARMLLNGGEGPAGRLISPESFALLTAPVIEMSRDGEESHYGYGLRIFYVDDRLHLGHGGGMVGYFASVVVDMVSGSGAVALINSPGDPHQFTRYALQLLRAAHDGRALPVSEPFNPRHVANAADYAGVYSSAQGTLYVVAEGERLLLEHRGERIPLEQRGNDSFFVNHSDFSLFLLRVGRQDETVVEAFHGSDWFVNGRYDGPQDFESPDAWSAFPGHYRNHNPWYSNFRVVLRKGALALIYPSGDEDPLTPLGDACFRVGSDSQSAERLRFDTVVDGVALRANFSGGDYYRFFTP